jgi:hypothetical protein
VRSHGNYPYAQLWPFGAAERTIIASGEVAVARFEPVQHDGATWGWLDVTFALDDATQVLCGILVDLVALARNDPSALVFPSSAASALDAERAWGLTAFLLPHLRLLTRARAVPIEEILRFVPCPAFEDARDAGELGAAPLPVALARMAPWVAAARLATTGPLAITARNGELGAAVARSFGIPVTVSSRIHAGGWYRIAPGDARGAPEVIVADAWTECGTAPVCVVLDAAVGGPNGSREVHVPTPLPMEAVLTFDPDDAPEAGRFTVVAPEARMSALLGRRADEELNRR